LIKKGSLGAAFFLDGAHQNQQRLLNVAQLLLKEER
jgi:hypothetical protein